MHPQGEARAAGHFCAAGPEPPAGAATGLTFCPHGVCSVAPVSLSWDQTDERWAFLTWLFSFITYEL